MSVLIDISSGGVVVEGIGSTRPRDIRQQLLAYVPSKSILSYRGRFVIPQNLAHLLVNAFSGKTVKWTPAARTLATRQLGEIRQHESAKTEVAAAVSDPLRFLSDYRYLHKLDSHQINAVAAICAASVKGIALFDEQGLGKTISALCAFDRMRELDILDKLLVVAPKSVLSSWVDDAHRMFEHGYVVRIASGSVVTRRRCIREEFDILIFNYECLIAELQLFIRTIESRKTRVLFVVDESYFVKNRDARRSKAVAALRPHCSRTLILCGTPAPNSPHDLLNQIDVVSPEMSTRPRYVNSEDCAAKEMAQKALAEIICLRRLKKDVLPQIPGKHFEKILLDLQPLQQSLYRKVKNELVVEVRGLDDGTFRKRLRSFLARRSALLQICSHPGALDRSYTEVPAKLLALDQLLEGLIKQKQKKVVVWSFYRYTLEAIANRYSHYGIARIDGSVTKIKDRSDAIKRFQSDENVKLFVGNAAAAGAGITLTAAHDAIYESFSNQAAHYMQSVDRIHRRGQKFPTTYYVLLGANTIEEGQFDRILQKERDGQGLLGDRYEEPLTRERFLRELDVIPTP